MGKVGAEVRAPRRAAWPRTPGLLVGCPLGPSPALLSPEDSAPAGASQPHVCPMGWVMAGDP